VQDRRKNIWREVSERRWGSLEELNTWLMQACQSSWSELAHPEWHELTVADVWQDERARLTPCHRYPTGEGLFSVCFGFAEQKN
jgi:hypothetical protein